MSLNSGVIFLKLIVSVLVQRFIALYFKESGVALIAQLRSLIQIVANISSFGQFNAVLKYYSEFKENNEQLSYLFSTVGLFYFISSLICSLTLFLGADFFSLIIFSDESYSVVIFFVALIVPFIGMNRLFNAIINANSHYKIYSKIEFVVYIISTLFIIIFIFLKSIKGVLFSVALSPVIQFFTIIIFYFKIFRAIFRNLNFNFKLNYVKDVLLFSLMSFTSVFLVNYVDINLRFKIGEKISLDDAGMWSAMTNISKNYMLFSSIIFTMYIVPKFAKINNGKDYVKEVFFVCKSILPIYGIGMLLVYFLRNYIVSIIYPNFDGLDILFKMQLAGDFVKVCSLIIAHQFIAKKMVKSFIFSEFFSIISFYVLSLFLIEYYGTEGIVIAHFIRYILYLTLVCILVYFYFNNKKKNIGKS